MPHPTKDGWLTWNFNRRESKDDVWKFSINVNTPVEHGTYFEELYKNAAAMRDYYSGTFDVLLSGGIDSEVVVRTFKDMGIKHNTFIFRFENSYNRRDVECAVDIAECLNIPYKVVDFPLQKFYENDAYGLFQKARCIRAGRLQHLAFLDMLDNIPIMGDGDCYWTRVNGGDFSSKSEWVYPMDEAYHATSMYMGLQQREAVCDWYEFTPSVMASFKEQPIIRALINDEVPGKQSTWSSRIQMYQQQWPDIKPKIKLIGLEGDAAPGTLPPFVSKLQEMMDVEVGPGNNYGLTQRDFMAWQNSTKN